MGVICACISGQTQKGSGGVCHMVQGLLGKSAT